MGVLHLMIEINSHLYQIFLHLLMHTLIGIPSVFCPCIFLLVLPGSSSRYITALLLEWKSEMHVYITIEETKIYTCGYLGTFHMYFGSHIISVSCRVYPICIQFSMCIEILKVVIFCWLRRERSSWVSLNIHTSSVCL